ncbi:MAG TPA: hypothetical protein VIS96_04065 [Terrimicrobiaceae bacterium]
MPERTHLAFVARCILLVLLAGIAIALLVAPKPWEHSPLSKLEDSIRVYSWWAGLINLGPLTILTLTTRWWTQPLLARVLENSPKLPKGFLLRVGGAMAACAIPGFPRLGQSLWEDEEYSVLSPERWHTFLYGKPLDQERPADCAIHGIPSPCDRPPGPLLDCHRCRRWAFAQLREFPAARWPGTLLAIALVGTFAMLSHPARHFLLTWCAKRYRESVLATRPSLDPNAPENLRIITAAPTQLERYKHIEVASECAPQE